MKHLIAVMALLALCACASQSVGPGGVDQSFGPFHQSVGPGGVSQGAGPYGPSQNVGGGGVQQSAGPYGPSQSTSGSGVNQSAGPYGPSQSVSPNGVQQSSGTPPKMTLTGMTVSQPGASAGTTCRATCAGKQYAMSCPADQRATCQCSTTPYASCVAVHH